MLVEVEEQAVVETGPGQADVAEEEVREVKQVLLEHFIRDMQAETVIMLLVLAAVAEEALPAPAGLKIRLIVLQEMEEKAQPAI
jgi:hypothetical protein